MTVPYSVVVGSTNPAKLESVRQAFQGIWTHRRWDIKGLRTSSGVAEQPLDETETLTGARNRAQAAIEQDGAQFGVGLEGGLIRVAGRWMECGWIVILNQDGLEGVASTARISIPDHFYQQMQAGQTLGDICDDEFETNNVGQNAGYFGLMTNNVVTRTSAYREAVAFALAVFVHPELFARIAKAAGE
jgi:inosine/xanthosine triphosphatase